MSTYTTVAFGVPHLLAEVGSDAARVPVRARPVGPSIRSIASEPRWDRGVRLSGPDRVEEDPDRSCRGQGRGDRVGADQGLPLREIGDAARAEQSEPDTDQATGQRQADRLDQELNRD
jgi:hypothetical protein